MPAIARFRLPKGSIPLGGFFKRNYWVILAALAAAAVLALPYALMSFERDFYRRNYPEYFQSWEFNGSFSPIDSYYSSHDNYLYAARIRHAGSHWLPGDPYIRGNKSLRIRLTNFVTFAALGWVYRILGSIRWAWSVSQFLCALAWVALLFALLRRMGASAGLALFGATGLTVFADMPIYGVIWNPIAESLKQLFFYGLWPIGGHHIFFGSTRIANPGFTFPCLFAAALLFLRAVKKRDARSAWISGLAGGALFYVLISTWVVYACAGAGLAARQWLRSRRFPAGLAASLGLTLLVGLPGFLVLANSSDVYPVLMIKQAFSFEWGSLVYLVVMAAVLRYVHREPASLWVGFAVGAMFFGYNSHLLTGWSSQALFHWTWFGNIFIVLLLLRAAQRLRWKDVTWRWLTLVVLLLALPRANGYAANHFRLFGMRADEEAAFHWLERNTPPDSVVAALNPRTNFKLPVHSHNRTLIAFLLPLYSDISVAENARRIVYGLSLYDVSLDRFLEYAGDDSGRWAERLWTGAVDAGSWGRSKTYSLYFYMLAGPARLAALRAAVRSPRPDGFPAEYLWVGPFERELAGLSPASACPERTKKLYRNASVSVCRIER